MDLQATYIQIREHQRQWLQDAMDTFSSVEIDEQINHRSLMLTRFCCVIWNKRRGVAESSLNISDREALIHLLYEKLNALPPNLHDIPLSLVLKILDPEIHQIDLSRSFELSEVERLSTRWLVGRSQWLSEHSAIPAKLPEIHWCDLPTQLVDLGQEN